jgi:hypothetical protein
MQQLSKARPSTQLAPLSELSKLSKIVMLLGTLAIRRQAKITDQDYQVFASDLEHFDLIDIESATVAIAKRTRAEGETAFPEVQAIVEAAQAASRNRRIAGERERRMSDEAAERRRRVEHPEEFEPIGPDDLEAMAAKLPNFNFERPKEIVIAPPAMLACPQCSAELPVAQNIRLWEPSELREQADRIEEIRRIAAKNREAEVA